MLLEAGFNDPYSEIFTAYEDIQKCLASNPYNKVAGYISVCLSVVCTKGSR